MRKIEEVKYNNSIDACGKCGNDRITTQQSKFSSKHFWYAFGIVAALGTFTGVILGAAGMVLGFITSIIPAIIIAIIAGFAGQGSVVNLCGNCGNKWRVGE